MTLQNSGEGYHLGVAGHEILCQVDEHLHSKIHSASDRIDEISESLHKMNKLIEEFESLRRSNPDAPTDLSSAEDMICEMQDKFYQDFPNMDHKDRLIPHDLDLTKVEPAKLNHIVANIESIKSRYQNQISIVTQKLNTDSNLYRIITEICSEMAKISREEKSHSVRRQVS